jgi:hypothetical protein
MGDVHASITRRLVAFIERPITACWPETTED